LDRKLRQLVSEFGEKLVKDCVDIANKLRLLAERPTDIASLTS